MDESQDVIMKLLSEVDEKAQIILEMQEQETIFRGILEKLRGENEGLVSQNFELTARILEMEQKLMEEAGEISLINFELLDE